LTSRRISVAELMARSGVAFGTSGARGLVEAMSDEICYLYVRAFLQYMEHSGVAAKGSSVAVAGDLRPSTPTIIRACLKAIEDAGFRGEFCGFIPSPAVALYGLEQQIPSIMVTGSHIPDDRNGIKFNKPQGEILKADEAAMRDQLVAVPDALFDGQGKFVDPERLPAESPSARELYIRRFIDFFDSDSLRGMRVGLYQHSSVSRDILREILESLGAEVIALGRSDRFVPVDTEAIRPEDIELAAAWSQQHRLDSVVSTDGDGDRPLISDENGEWLRGDIAGILCAHYLQATAVVTPVSSNSAVELSGLFQEVRRTRIGSPYVISGMEDAMTAGYRRVIGYEANGGLLQADNLSVNGRTLVALPTRDAAIVIVAILAMSREQQQPISSLVAYLPRRFTFSDRLKQFPTEVSRSRLARIGQADDEAAQQQAADLFGDQFGQVSRIDVTDGVRISFSGGDVVHLRPSGNAPELRCYTEADSAERARKINATCMQILESWRS
jgi:phosphomannomutase